MTEGLDRGSGGRRVLVVEDEALVSMLLEEMLADIGYDVVGAVGQLDEAMRLAKEIDCDLVVLDVNLDGRQTYGIAETLTARCIPFIFATGYGMQGLKSPWSNVPTLQKPFQIRDLENAIERLRTSSSRQGA
ncbi:MAG: response regulator [Xanthobacteraceae bacterium]